MAHYVKANKKETTQRILDFGKQMACTKLEIKNIIFPKWNEFGLLGLMLRQCVVTKEQPRGHIYDETKFMIVVRIIDNRLLINGKPDCICWSFDMFEKTVDKKLIGLNSAEGLKNASVLLSQLSDDKERTLLADMLILLKKDLFIVTSAAENRICIEVTQNMLKSGITYCVDSWMTADASGFAPITYLNLGDFLIVEGENVYRIGHDEFVRTHKLI